VSGGEVAALALALAGAAWILAPLLRGEEALVAGSPADAAADLQSEREMALGALRDLEDDRATGKIGDADYEDLRARFTARAVEVMKRIDEAEAPAGPRPLRGEES